MVMGLFGRSDYGAAGWGLVPLSRQENWGKSLTRSAMSVTSDVSRVQSRSAKPWAVLLPRRTCDFRVSAVALRRECGQWQPVPL